MSESIVIAQSVHLFSRIALWPHKPNFTYQRTKLENREDGEKAVTLVML